MAKAPLFFILVELGHFLLLVSTGYKRYPRKLHPLFPPGTFFFFSEVRKFANITLFYNP